MTDSASAPASFPEGVEHQVDTPDGRTLTCLSVGDPQGPLVLHNHGGPGSRFEARAFGHAAEALGLHLVAIDRPGQGGSTPQEHRTFAGWAGDLETVANAFGAATFGVTGWSEGGPWALAAAACISPARLRHVTNIAGGCYGTFGANWAAAHLSGQDALGGMLALHFRPGFKLMYDLLELDVCGFAGSFRQQMRAAACPYDQAVMDDDAFWEVFSASTRACFAQGAEGLVRDARMLYEAWPFDVARIARPVHHWQGTSDTFVPAAINRAVADAMPGAVWHEVPGGGHFIAVAEAASILSNAKSDLTAG